MARNPVHRDKLRSTLIIISLGTLPLYLLGMIVMWVGNAVKNRPTLTPTLEVTVTENPWGGIATNTLPPIPTYPTENTKTPTITLTPSKTSTFMIPSDTPTLSPTPSSTPTETAKPTETPTVATTEPPVVEPTATP
jgi:hypothetical protein